MKPCPFCGGKELDVFSTAYSEWYVVCNNCGTEGPVGHTEEKGIELWDKRV